MAFRAHAVVLWGSFLALGCGSKPPPPPAPPPEPLVAKVEPPPPPKCEALEESCKADAKTHARIARTSYVFSPVAGWVYAQTEAATVTEANAEAGPAMVVAGYDANKDAKKELSDRDQAFATIAKEIKLTLPKAKANWKKPLCTCSAKACKGSGGDLCKAMKPVSELKASVWQLDGGMRGGKKGPMLIVQAPLGDGKALLGVGFVPDDDQTAADQAILKSIESIGPAVDAGADAPKDGDKK
ncbi:MAG TPA: hypothetical protein VHB21_26460 [Minicystis sp.]|nr:hypothetical protein [Minicystis sp.]